MNSDPNAAKINVLVVEDDEDDFVLTSSLLAEIYTGNFVPEWVKTYEDAIKRVCENHYDICLLDYRLGAHDGLELLRHARQRGCDAPVILLTGQGDLEVDMQAMKAGASDYLVKGQINAANLERSIRYAIQQKQMAEERIRRIREQEARTQAEAANQAKDEFLAMVSHELRTPLNSMLGWVGILRGNQEDPDIRGRAIDAIERSAQAQNKLVNDLLDITRIANGNLWIERQPVPLVNVIESAIDEVFPAANAKSIAVDVNLDHSVGLVSGDPNRLQQVMNNLLQNAVKFTPEGGRVAVRLERDAESAKVTVADTGKGIDREFLPFVFDRYRQAKDTADRRGGLGLGLAITRHIVELHGGSIAADSEGAGRGATFTLILPLMASAGSASA
jgi:signal transduction histidine kinase